MSSTLLTLMAYWKNRLVLSGHYPFQCLEIFSSELSYYFKREKCSYACSLVNSSTRDLLLLKYLRLKKPHLPPTSDPYYSSIGTWGSATSWTTSDSLLQDSEQFQNQRALNWPPTNPCHLQIPILSDCHLKFQIRNTKPLLKYLKPTYSKQISPREFKKKSLLWRSYSAKHLL